VVLIDCSLGGCKPPDAIRNNPTALTESMAPHGQPTQAKMALMVELPGGQRKVLKSLKKLCIIQDLITCSSP
jgi:hypothetical protein